MSAAASPRSALVAAAPLLLSLVLAACAPERAHPPRSVIDAVAERGVMRVGLSLFTPWAMRGRDGALVGFEIDVATRLARDIGVRAELLPTEWEDLIPALNTGAFDIVISGMTVTPERNRKVNFTVPYAHSSLGVVASRDRAGGLAWPRDYDAPGITFLCRRGTTPCGWIADNFPRAALRRLDDPERIAGELLKGRAHAAVASQPEATFLALDHPALVFEPTRERIAPQSEAFALRKGDPDALNFLDNWIRIHRMNGWLEERHRYWFGGRPWRDRVENPEAER